MKLGETVAYYSLIVVFFFWAILSRLHLFTGFGGQAGCDMNTSYIFPKNMQIVITLVEYGRMSEMKGQGLDPCMNWGFFSAQCLLLPYHAEIRSQVA